MKRRLPRLRVLVFVFACGMALFLGIPSAVSAYNTAKQLPVNQNGQTYGSGYVEDPSNPVVPDLVLAIGKDDVHGEVHGYISNAEIDNYFGPRPNTLEEAAAYSKRVEEELTELAEDALARGDEYIYYVPLYESDGETVIGRFGLGHPAEYLAQYEK
ncbi:MAG: hypothetical protein LBT44_10635 [Clostridiales bacterium]|jgi:hypothetical protein|nr:hypothetical protein [Clostridiales bacterium]